MATAVTETTNIAIRNFGDRIACSPYSRTHGVSLWGLSVVKTLTSAGIQRFFFPNRGSRNRDHFQRRVVFVLSRVGTISVRVFLETGLGSVDPDNERRLGFGGEPELVGCKRRSLKPERFAPAPCRGSLVGSILLIRRRDGGGGSKTDREAGFRSRFVLRWNRPAVRDTASVEPVCRTVRARGTNEYLRPLDRLDGEPVLPVDGSSGAASF